MTDKVMQELLLEKFELQEMYEKWLYEKECLAQEGKLPEKGFGELVAQAQLAKAEPLIRKDERERINSLGNLLLKGYEASKYTGGYELVKQFWQALKGGAPWEN